MKEKKSFSFTAVVRFLGVLLLAASMAVSCGGNLSQGDTQTSAAQNQVTETQEAETKATGAQAAAGAESSAGDESAGATKGPSSTPKDGTLEVHFLDVGQADCTLLVCDGEAMVIDAGNNADANTIKDYFNEQGIKELKYAIGTHPHEDHIGSMDAVIGIWPPETLFLPQVETETRSFQDVLHAAEKKNVPITRPVIGQKYDLGGASFQILGPITDYGDELNNWSIALKVTYGDCTFLFTGDAENEAEEDLCESGQDLSADVYQVGHHGSSTATGTEFLKRVNPKYAVISCGQGNDYGHPTAQTLERLDAQGAEIFRTDEQGTVVALCDGKDIVWSTDPSASRRTGEKEPEPAATFETVTEVSADADYVLNTRSKKFHLPSCDSAKTIAVDNYSEFQGSREELIAEGYEPCGRCKP